ncbi:MAG: hypothetical protein ACFFE4_19680, partial [Candidatus Thorarchaeota archaeon]
MKKISGNPLIVRKNSKIIIDSVPLDNLIERFETPFMIFLENRIRDNINSFNIIFSEIFENFQSYYSMKANYL